MMQTVTLNFVTKTPLHVGAGFSVPIDFLTSSGDKEKADIALTQTDCNGEPYIPGTTLKGALRALLQSTHAGELFGKPGDEGTPGQIIVSGAKCLDRGDTGKRKDVATEASGDFQKRGTLINQRVSIDGATGTAADAKLFMQEMVPPGTMFEVRLKVPDTLKNPDLLGAVYQALRTNGLHIGRGTNDGSGWLALADAATLPYIETDGSTLRAPKASFTMTLSGADTFGVLGVTNRKKKKDEEHPTKKADENVPNNVLEAVRSADGRVELPGSSLSGALRAKANWFAARQALRKSKGNAGSDYGDDASHPDHPIHRLFGRDADVVKEGAGSFAGTLKIISITPEDSGLRTMPQIKIDRITQGTIDGALFEMEMFLDARFTVAFEIDERATDEDLQFAKDFFAYLADKADPSSGLMLGHASNRGHGWFDVDANWEEG